MKNREFLEKSVAGEISVEDQVEFLSGFEAADVRAEDLRDFAEFMIENMPSKLNLPGAIDVCGTGGSGLPRINTSTLSAFILAELGVGVAKHGNRAASGRFGSFDLLEKLGVDIEKEAGALEEVYERCGLAFIYARKFHPVMKHFVEARQKFGKPSIFNLLGPLLNPAGAEYQIIGTSFEGQMRVIAETCKLLGKKKVLVVRGEDGLDEVSLSGKTKVVELCDDEIREYGLEPSDFGVESCDFEEVSGGDAEFNVRVARQILNAEATGGRHADLVFVNAALALKMMGKVNCLKEGYAVAKSVVGARKLAHYRGDILAEIAASKVITPSVRSFREALSGEGISVIAEVKKASPSAGRLMAGDFDPSKIAEEYISGGASAISVLTDEEYFQGSFENLRKVRAVAHSTPLLCKDFIVHEYQIYKAREFGADAVLLIAKILDEEKMRQFLEIVSVLEMDALVEVHDEEDIEKAVGAGAEIIGINNRDLSDFSVDLGLSNRLVELIPEGRIVVSESGISSREDVDRLDRRFNAILVGSALMKAENVKEKIHELI